MTKKAFTLIELLIVITIIILISSSGIFYFFRQVSSLKIASEIEKVTDIIDRLDSNVDTKEILDYSIIIKKSDKYWFTYSENNLWLDYRQKINLIFETWTWVLSTTKTSTWSNYSFKIYSWIKFQWKNIIDASENYEFNFLENIEHKITWTLSWSILNNIYIKYYSSDNLIINNENKLILSWIYQNSDKSWLNCDSVEIKNLNWKKSIKWNIWWELEKIYLFFEREWVEKFIEIKK